jgi:NAD(P)-dependent dehydrogenase (short-subunit alcohol dehydrogenase family)
LNIIPLPKEPSIGHQAIIFLPGYHFFLTAWLYQQGNGLFSAIGSSLKKGHNGEGAGMKFDSLKDKVVLITGASSGIGKLATEEFLKQGAKVVLAARSLDAMQEHMDLLGLDENRAIAVQVDVSDPEQMNKLAEKAKTHFGRLDIWINNAAVSIYGPMESLKPDEVSRIIDVNLKGQFFGSQEAIRIFKDQGYGNLINVSSALGKGSTPLQAAYTATKHGIVGFSSCLREELIHQSKYKNIDVSVVMPSSMDTPLFKHAKSNMGVEPYPIPPVYDPIITVREIIRCALNPKSEVVAGRAGGVMVWAYRLFPNLLEKYQGKTAIKNQLTNKPKPMEGNDNLFEPMPDQYGIRGGIGTTGEHIATYIRKHPAKISLIISLPLLVLGSAFFLRRRLA